MKTSCLGKYSIRRFYFWLFAISISLFLFTKDIATAGSPPLMAPAAPQSPMDSEGDSSVLPENLQTGDSDVESPTLVTDLVPNVNLPEGNPWSPPDFANQGQALGYAPNVFGIPVGMEARVSFWMDIYTKYSTNQGVIHDSKYVNLVYSKVDFSDINSDTSLSPRQMAKARKSRLKAEKAMVVDRLKRLAKLSSPSGLTGEDMRVWYLFAENDEKNKFIEAAKDGRLRFQLGQSDRFMQGIYESGKYLPLMEEIFRNEGLPIELTRIVFVESSFNLRARSKVGASGIWQFMRKTGRQYLRLNNEVDERNDPLIATRAAARKLRENYKMLGSWPLAVTGYNHGPSGVRRLVASASTTDIAELTDVRRGRFGFASASFYASFLAALEVERQAQKFFGSMVRAPLFSAGVYRVSNRLSADELLAFFDQSVESAKEYNPHILEGFWKKKFSLSASQMVRVPLAKAPAFEKRFAKIQKVAEISGVGTTALIAAGESEASPKEPAQSNLEVEKGTMPKKNLEKTLATNSDKVTNRRKNEKSGERDAKTATPATQVNRQLPGHSTTPAKEIKAPNPNPALAVIETANTLAAPIEALETNGIYLDTGDDPIPDTTTTYPSF